MTRAIAQRVTAVTAVDVSPRMLEIARTENSPLENVTWMLGDGATLEGVLDASADACISYVVLQHIPDREVIYGYVREMGRVLRPGGWAVFQVSDSPKPHRPVFQGVRRRWASLRGRMPKGQRSRAWLGARVDLADLRAAASDGGLELERIEGEGTQFCIVRARRG